MKCAQCKRRAAIMYLCDVCGGPRLRVEEQRARPASIHENIGNRDVSSGEFGGKRVRVVRPWRP